MRLLRGGWLAMPVVAAIAAVTVYLPYYSVGPGPARSVDPLIRFDDRPRFESEGSFVLTSVRFDQLTALGLVRAWLDPHAAVVPRSEIYPDGQTIREERERAISQMDQSKLDAAYVVLDELTGYPEEHGEGVLIEQIVDGCAADGELYPGDVVHAIDGVATEDVRDARRAIRAAPSGATLTFDVTADGEPHTIELVREPCGGSQRPLVGVSMIESFPFDVRISSGDIGGPSAGLAWALALYDLMTPGDITGGRTIATTGQLSVDGTVHPIGGVADKVVAAADAGATVFLLPEDNLGDARAVADDAIDLVAVETFDDAVAYLQSDA